MPFGDFDSFADCVEKNSDKSNPEAFCAWLHKRTTGKWPTEKMSLTEGMPDGLKSLFIESVDAWMNDEKGEDYAIKRATEAANAAGWAKRNGTWFRPKVENQMHLITGVTIFASGTYNGDSYTEADIDQMVNSYFALKGRVDCPLKLGHTSDEFNQQLAQKMGVLPELMQGENGKGAIALGWIENPRRYGDKLIADISGVPAAIKELIENKRYANLSAEIVLGYEDGSKQYPKVLTGVALLGAELPAVPDADLSRIAIYTKSVTGMSKLVELGGEGSGNWGHEGRPGEVGGSGGGGGGGGDNEDSNNPPAPDSIPTRYGKITYQNAVVKISERAFYSGSVFEDLVFREGSYNVRKREFFIPEGFGREPYQCKVGEITKLSEGGFDTYLVSPSKQRKFGKEDELAEDKELDTLWGDIKARLKALFGRPDKKPTETTEKESVEKEQLNSSDNKEAEDVKELCEILGLAVDATMEEVIAAVKKLQESAASVDTKEYSNAQAKLAQLEKDNATLKAEADAVKKSARRAYFVSKAQAWQAISGKPEELAENLMKIEAVSPELAELRVTEYEDENKRLMTLGVTKPIGTSKEGAADDEHPFNREVKAKMAADTKKSEAQAFAEVRKEKPLVFYEYMKSRPRIVAKEA